MRWWIYYTKCKTYQFVIFKNLMCWLFLRICEKLCLWTYLLENNQVRESVKFMVSIVSWTHVRDLLRPACETSLVELFLEIVNSENLTIFAKKLHQDPTCLAGSWQGHWRCSFVFIVNFEYISHLFVVFPLLTLNK